MKAGGCWSVPRLNVALPATSGPEAHDRQRRRHRRVAGGRGDLHVAGVGVVGHLGQGHLVGHRDLHCRRWSVRGVRDIDRCRWVGAGEGGPAEVVAGRRVALQRGGADAGAAHLDDLVRVGAGEGVDEAAGGGGAGVGHRGRRDAVVGRHPALQGEQVRLDRVDPGATDVRPVDPEEVGGQRRAGDRVRGHAVTEVRRAVRARDQAGVPAQERVDPGVERAGEVARGTDADVLGEVDVPGGRVGHVELVHAVRVGDHVVTGGRRGDPDPDPAEDDLLAGDRSAAGERGLEVVVQHRGGAVRQGDRRLGQLVEGLVREVVREADRLRGVGYAGPSPGCRTRC